MHYCLGHCLLSYLIGIYCKKIIGGLILEGKVKDENKIKTKTENILTLFVQIE